MLVVFVAFEDNPSTNPAFTNAEHAHEWDMSKNKGLPEFVDAKTGRFEQFFFQTPEEFSTRIDSVEYNYSKDFYLMSKGGFRVMGEVFKDSNNLPAVVRISPEGCAGWTHTNKKAWEAMQKLNPRADFARFDTRKNSPNFDFDNSTSQPDKILDYVIFVYRYKKDWGASIQPAPGMQNWIGSGGGFASTGLWVEDPINGYKCVEGFTMSHNSGVFIHEIGHTLHNAPHLWGTNGVVGDYFYRPAIGWGVTSSIALFKAGFFAWERWYLGFMDLVADIKIPEKLPFRQTFRLRDFQVSGDAARVELPFSKGQYVWFENHQIQHGFDKHVFNQQTIGADTMQNAPAGMYMYVSPLPDSRNHIIAALSSWANSVRPLNAAGNYDYALSPLPPLVNAWGNDLYHWKRGAANPLSGLNPYWHYPFDKNKNGALDINPDYNTGKSDSWFILREEIAPDSFANTYAGFGQYAPQKAPYYTRTPAFQPGDILDMSSNPMLTNHPKFSYQQQKLEPFYLNGLKVSILKVAKSKDLEVLVEYGQTSISKNTRWAGEIVLPNISQNAEADAVLAPKVRLILDKSQTPNRQYAQADGSFVNPTILRINADACLKLSKNSVLEIRQGASLELEKGAKIILEKGAKLLAPEAVLAKIPKEAIQAHPSARLIKKD
jgi:hypothetical protein